MPSEDSKAAADWEREYRSGRWDYLASPEQAPRYAVLASWCRRLVSDPTILDVGCGEALLLEFLERTSYRRYHGIDVAPTALHRAQKRIIDSDREFLARIPAEDFDPATVDPDLVLFNESLYDCTSPLVTLERFLAAIRSGYVLLSISNYHAKLAAEVRNVYANRLACSLLLRDSIASKEWHLLAIEGRAGERRYTAS